MAISSPTHTECILEWASDVQVPHYSESRKLKSCIKREPKPISLSEGETGPAKQTKSSRMAGKKETMYTDEDNLCKYKICFKDDKTKAKPDLQFSTQWKPTCKDIGTQSITFEILDTEYDSADSPTGTSSLDEERTRTTETKVMKKGVTPCLSKPSEDIGNKNAHKTHDSAKRVEDKPKLKPCLKRDDEVKKTCSEENLNTQQCLNSLTYENTLKNRCEGHDKQNIGRSKIHQKPHHNKTSKPEITKSNTTSNHSPTDCLLSRSQPNPTPHHTRKDLVDSCKTLFSKQQLHHLQPHPQHNNSQPDNPPNISNSARTRTKTVERPFIMQAPESQTVQAIRAEVIMREDVIESPTDPRPNAFFCLKTGVLRVYHGPQYGNPYATIAPLPPVPIGTYPPHAGQFVAQAPSVPPPIPTPAPTPGPRHFSQTHNSPPRNHNFGGGNSHEQYFNGTSKFNGPPVAGYGPPPDSPMPEWRKADLAAKNSSYAGTMPGGWVNDGPSTSDQQDWRNDNSGIQQNSGMSDWKNDKSGNQQNSRPSDWRNDNSGSNWNQNSNGNQHVGGSQQNGDNNSSGPANNQQTAGNQHKSPALSFHNANGGSQHQPQNNFSGSNHGGNAPAWQNQHNNGSQHSQHNTPQQNSSGPAKPWNSYGGNQNFKDSSNSNNNNMPRGWNADSNNNSGGWNGDNNNGGGWNDTSNNNDFGNGEWGNNDSSNNNNGGGEWGNNDNSGGDNWKNSSNNNNINNSGRGGGWGDNSNQQNCGSGEWNNNNSGEWNGNDNNQNSNGQNSIYNANNNNLRGSNWGGGSNQNFNSQNFNSSRSNHPNSPMQNSGGNDWNGNNQSGGGGGGSSWGNDNQNSNNPNGPPSSPYNNSGGNDWNGNNQSGGGGGSSWGNDNRNSTHQNGPPNNFNNNSGPRNWNNNNSGQQQSNDNSNNNEWGAPAKPAPWGDMSAAQSYGNDNGNSVGNGNGEWNNNQNSNNRGNWNGNDNNNSGGGGGGWSGSNSGGNGGNNNSGGGGGGWNGNSSNSAGHGGNNNSGGGGGWDGNNNNSGGNNGGNKQWQNDSAVSVGSWAQGNAIGPTGMGSANNGGW
jgi:hypothetical protein